MVSKSFVDKKKGYSGSKATIGRVKNVFKTCLFNPSIANESIFVPNLSFEMRIVVVMTDFLFFRYL